MPTRRASNTFWSQLRTKACVLTLTHVLAPKRELVHAFLSSKRTVCHVLTSQEEHWCIYPASRTLQHAFWLSSGHLSAFFGFQEGTFAFVFAPRALTHAFLPYNGRLGVFWSSRGNTSMCFCFPARQVIVYQPAKRGVSVFWHSEGHFSIHFGSQGFSGHSWSPRGHLSVFWLQKRNLSMRFCFSLPCIN